MAVVTFICYYGKEEWNTNLTLKDMGRLSGKYQKMESYLTDHRLNRLYQFLILEKRYDDLQKATVDEDFRKELYEEHLLVY